jgi:hypothetical protein
MYRTASSCSDGAHREIEKRKTRLTLIHSRAEEVSQSWKSPTPLHPGDGDGGHFGARAGRRPRWRLGGTATVRHPRRGGTATAWRPRWVGHARAGRRRRGVHAGDGNSSTTSKLGGTAMATTSALMHPHQRLGWTLAWSTDGPVGYFFTVLQVLFFYL